MPLLPRRVLTSLLVGVAVLVAVTAGALATGRIAVVVTNGVSMNPVYYQGDLVVVVRESSYQVGQIVAYDVPGTETIVLHRIIAGDAAGFTIKGDNNQSTDVTRPTGGQLLGTAVVHLPGAGVWLQRLTSPPVVGLVLFGLLIAGGSVTRTRRQRKRATVPRPSLSHSGTFLAVTGLAPAVRTAAAITACVGVLTLALAALAWSSPLEQSATSHTPGTGQMVFSYTADVGDTAAYDTATAASPDPVFRKLAGIVDVQYSYRGDPGSITVIADLSTPGGWHTTIPLAMSTAFAGDRYDGTVQLDLDSFDARAAAAAAVTGMPAGAVTIEVTPLVTTTSGEAFAATLKLTLTPLQLALVGDDNALTVTDSATTPGSVQSPTMLNLAGAQVTVGTVRILSTVLVVTVLLATAGLVLHARRTTPTDERDRIHRRYPALLVPVHPMPTPPGRPVIDVTEFDTLAKLAERYGLLVLHWSRSDVETFLVQDEGTTYRYRTGAGIAPTDTPATTNAAAQT